LLLEPLDLAMRFSFKGRVLPECSDFLPENRPIPTTHH
jgi:hypothetical protein